MGNFFVISLSLFVLHSHVHFYLETGRVRQLKDVSDISTIHNAQGHDKGHYARPRLHGGVSRDSGQLQLSRGLRKWQASHECHLRGAYISSSKQTYTTTTTTATTRSNYNNRSPTRSSSSQEQGRRWQQGARICVCVLSVY